jgi:hypothetical protein
MYTYSTTVGPTSSVPSVDVRFASKVPGLEEGAESVIGTPSTVNRAPNASLSLLCPVGRGRDIVGEGGG